MTENPLSTLKTEDVAALLEKTASEAVKRFRQELLAQNEELIDQALKKYKSKVARRSWQVAQQWCKFDNDGPVLQADKVRLYYRRGNTEVVVQEVPPQIRHMKFSANLALKSNSSDPSPTEGQDQVYSYSLALPYINFIYRFKDGMMEKSMVTFCDRPLKHLSEQPLKPYLSNVNNDLRICHGSAFDHSDLIKGNVTQQISYMLDLFWQTVYRDEWSQNFWEYKSWFGERDQRLASLENWQNATLEEGPLFVVSNDVEWIKYSEDNYGTMLVRLFDHDTVDATFQQKLYDDLVDNFLDDLKGDLDKKFKEYENLAKFDVDSLAQEFMTKIGELISEN